MKTASVDLGTAPDTAIFKKPLDKRKKKIKSFKEIALAQETDTFLKETANITGAKSK